MRKPGNKMISTTDTTQRQHDQMPGVPADHGGDQAAEDDHHDGPQVTVPAPVATPKLPRDTGLPRGRNRLPWRDD